MKRYIIFLILLILPMMFGCQTSQQAKEDIEVQSVESDETSLWKNDNNMPSYEVGAVIVKIKKDRVTEFLSEQLPKLAVLFPDLQARRAFDDMSLDNVSSETNGLDRIYVVYSSQIFNTQRTKLTKSSPIDNDTLRLYEKLKERMPVSFEYVQFNRLNRLLTNDQYYRELWHLNNFGQKYPTGMGIPKGGLKGADISAEKGWNIDRSNRADGLIVGVIDSGLDLTHPDIQKNIWVNPGEDLNQNGQIDENEKNNRDDDRNGYADDFYGYDFGAEGDYRNSVKPDNDPTDEHGHGTHVSGIISGSGDNSTGIVGVAYNAKILMAKVFPSGFDTVVAEGVIYTANNGADVINMSLGREGQEDEQGVLRDAIEYAKSLNIPVIVAAGNDNMDSVYFHPANVPSVITIAASTSKDQKASYSNYGVKIDIGAPGTDILSLRADSYLGLGIYRGNYLVMSGTSMAAPVTAGVVGLIKANNPNFSIEQIRQVLRYSADDAGKIGYDEYFGYGRLNLEKALQVNSIPEVNFVNLPYTKEKISSGDTIQGRVMGSNLLGWRLSYAPVGNNQLTALISGQSSVNGSIFVWRQSSAPSGIYYLILEGFDSTGTKGVDVRKVEVRY